MSIQTSSTGDIPAVRAALMAKGMQSRLARAAGVRGQAVNHWVKCRVPRERVDVVCRVTGLSRHEVRPDLYPHPTHWNVLTSVPQLIKRYPMRFMSFVKRICASWWQGRVAGPSE